MPLNFLVTWLRWLKCQHRRQHLLMTQWIITFIIGLDGCADYEVTAKKGECTWKKKRFLYLYHPFLALRWRVTVHAKEHKTHDFVNGKCSEHIALLSLSTPYGYYMVNLNSYWSCLFRLQWNHRLFSQSCDWLKAALTYAKSNEAML